MSVRIEKVNEQVFNVFWSNGKHIGTFEIDVDGFYYYWNNGSYGSWSAEGLSAIAHKLEEINKPFKEIVDEYFRKEREEPNCSCGEGVKVHGESYCRSCLGINPLWCN